MKLTISEHVQKQIKKISKPYQIIVGNRIRRLTGQFVLGEEKLQGYKNYYRVRAGVYRIIFMKYASEIEIVLIGHRKEIYLLLKNF